MKFESMQDLFLGQIQDLYDAEQRLVKALPQMAEAASSPQLRAAFEGHLAETRGHVQRLERIFIQMGEDPKGTTCDAMKGLIKEGDSVISDMDQSPLRDAGLIAAANRVEHYEIAAYGSARTFAQTLGLTSAVSLLEETLQEEKQADQKLTRLAEGMINNGALRLGGQERSATR
jgi:ferritin-like metal-binding protein YciE